MAATQGSGQESTITSGLERMTLQLPAASMISPTMDQLSSAEPTPTASTNFSQMLPTPLADKTRHTVYMAERTTSPPPTLSPTLALDACPQLDRSVSTASSASSVSGRSNASHRLSDSGLSVGKRRGYMRPQATVFSDSARNRDSVMSLGSIAHLQYYFARTGLLDGKGGQLFKGNSQKLFKRKSSIEPRSTPRAVSMSIVEAPSNYLGADTDAAETISETGLVESPIDAEGEEADWDQDAMFPPTVSTYNHKPIYVPPPPDLTMLRRELTEALEDALKVLKEADKCPDESQGWYEIQGLHLLDITTLAIRAAKNYYTAHTQPQRLYGIKSERKIRSELYEVLEILKRLASRNFAGGVKQTEKVGILTWIVGISELIQTEIDQEKREQEEREKWSWRAGDWMGKEREREYLFLRSFIAKPEDMPEWTEAKDDSELPTPFLKFFQNGLQLVLLHNELVHKSKRHFEEIKAYHTDTAKPYRCAENLRFWVKAAQLRWDVDIKDMDVMGVVHGKDPAAWQKFDAAIMKWSQVVREEITNDLSESKSLRKTPTLRIEPHPPASSCAVLQVGVQESA